MWWNFFPCECRVQKAVPTPMDCFGWFFFGFSPWQAFLGCYARGDRTLRRVWWYAPRFLSPWVQIGSSCWFQWKDSEAVRMSKWCSLHCWWCLRCFYHDSSLETCQRCRHPCGRVCMSAVFKVGRSAWGIGSTCNLFDWHFVYGLLFAGSDNCAGMRAASGYQFICRSSDSKVSGCLRLFLLSMWVAVRWCLASS